MKIKEIHINECGPLNKVRWTGLEEKNLILVYGQNESGKSFLIDLIINSLFKNKKEWGYVRSGTDGKVILTGIKGGEQLELRPASKKKLEDYLEQAGPGLPTELVKLLVVRAGEVEIVRESQEAVRQPQGLTLDFLKNLFSQKEILSNLAGRIPETAKNAQLFPEAGFIQIAAKGDKAKSYLNLRNEELPKLNNLLENVVSKYEQGELKTLELKKKELEEKKKNLLRAKRYKAFKLAEEITFLRDQVGKLPPEGDLDDVGKKIELFKEKTKEVLRLKKEIKDKNRELLTLRELENEFNLQIKAKNHYAYLLNKNKKNKADKLQRLEEDIKSLDHLLKNYRDLIRNRSQKEKELAKKKDLAYEYDSLRALKENYLKLKDAPQKPSSLFRVAFFISLFSILGSLVMLLIGKTVLSLALLFSSIVGLILLRIGYYRMSSLWGRSQELARIKKSYRERYGEDLKDIATLEAKENLLEREYHEIQAMERSVNEIRSEIDHFSQEIVEIIDAYGWSAVKAEDWENFKQNLEEKAKKLKEEIEEISESLYKLDVAERDYEIEDPGIKFDQEKFKLIEKRLDELNQLKNKANEESSQLKDLEIEMDQLQREIDTWFEENLGEKIEPEKWENRIRRLINEKQKLSEKIKEKEGELKGLGVSESEYLSDDPGFTFSSEEMKQTEEKLDKISQSIDAANKELNDLRTRIASAVNCDPLIAWPELLNNLYKKIEEKKVELKSREANLMAQILLAEVIKELDQEETEKVEEVINSPDVGEMLRRFTCRYNQIFLRPSADRQTELLWASDGREDFPLADLSTGAREQIMLALRIVFIKKLLKQGNCFLILDDAFQHSDYERRPIIINNLIELAASGWQIFYLTMDDHIKSLFMNKAASLKEKFFFISL